MSMPSAVIMQDSRCTGMTVTMRDLRQEHRGSLSMRIIKKINAAAQVNDPDSVFSYYKKLIELRHQMEIIVYGVYKSKAIEHPDVFAYTRTLGDEKLFVVCNFREQEMDFTLEDGFTGDEKVLISNYDDVVKTENGIYLRPYEAKVFYRK